ncbi:MAG: acyl-CoA desaturase [Salibacteraceae bacterium]
MAVFIFIVIHWYLSLFCQTFFHHRYSAHRMFTMSKGWERFFFFLSWLTQGSSYLSPYAYGILHRMHHAYADTDKDPHSPMYDSNLFTMMWRTKVIYSSIFHGTYPVEERFKNNLPEWFTFERFAEGWISRGFWMVLYVFIYTQIATSWWQYIFLPANFLMGPLHGAVINWFAHKYGKITFKTKDTSHNLLPVDVLMLGESYHNNHHRFPAKPNFGFKWFEIDPVYPFIRIFHALKIIKLKRVM